MPPIPIGPPRMSFPPSSRCSGSASLGSGCGRPSAVQAHIQVVEDVLDDLAEGQRHDGQIVAPETQHRNADEKADDAGAARRPPPWRSPAAADAVAESPLAATRPPSHPVKAPTLIKPAWPSDSSPSMPTVRFSEIAMHDIGADGHQHARVMELTAACLPRAGSGGSRKAAITTAYVMHLPPVIFIRCSVFSSSHPPHTFSRTCLPSRPAGLHQQHDDQHGEHDRRPTAGWRCRPWLKISMTPSRMPPSIAPGMEPMPPNTAAVKALMPGMRAGGGHAGSDTRSTAARRQRPPEQSRWQRSWRWCVFTLMPISCAAPLSSEHGAHGLAHLGLADEERERDHDDDAHETIVTSATIRDTQLAAEEGNTRLAAAPT